MNCPVDGTQLQMMERQGVEIDYCPQCRGIWLDRGELDKILDRSRQESAPDEQRRSSDEEYAPRTQTQPPKSRRRSFLEDLLEFD